MFDMFQLDFILQAFLLSVLTGLLLSYLGVHVVRRGIVFVDLALGQIASLGVAFSDYIGYGKTIIPITFALLGAFLMSLIQIRDRRLKLEAVIGIIYAVASAATVMLISKTPHGDSDIQEVLFGNILATDWNQIMILGSVFLVIGIAHALFYQKFNALTMRFESPGDTATQGALRGFRFWNFLFYISIGLAIVLAVRTSGVIPVFSFLIIPAVGAIMIARKDLLIILTAMGMSVLGAFLGLSVSYQFDFPAGSSLVSVLGGMFVVVAIFAKIRR